MDFSQSEFQIDEIIRVDDWVNCAEKRFRIAKVKNLNPFRVMFTHGTGSRIVKASSFKPVQFKKLTTHDLSLMKTKPEFLANYLLLKRWNPITKKSWLVKRALDKDESLTKEDAEDMTVVDLQKKVLEKFHRGKELYAQAEKAFAGECQFKPKKSASKKRKRKQVTQAPVKRKKMTMRTNNVQKKPKISIENDKPPSLTVEEVLELFQDIHEGFQLGAVSKEAFEGEIKSYLVGMSEQVSADGIENWVTIIFEITKRGYVKLSDFTDILNKNAIVKRVQKSADHRGREKLAMLQKLKEAKLINEQEKKSAAQKCYTKGWARMMKNKKKSLELNCCELRE